MTGFGYRAARAECGRALAAQCEPGARAALRVAVERPARRAGMQGDARPPSDVQNWPGTHQPTAAAFARKVFSMVISP